MASSLYFCGTNFYYVSSVNTNDLLENKCEPGRRSTGYLSKNIVYHSKMIIPQKYFIHNYTFHNIPNMTNSLKESSLFILASSLQ